MFMQKLKLYNKSKEFYIYMMLLLSSFPKVHTHYKIKIEDNLSLLIDNIVHANINSGAIRKKYIKECLVNISMLDFYTGVMYDLKIIEGIKYKKILKSLDDLKSLTYGWLNSEEVKD